MLISVHQSNSEDACHPSLYQPLARSIASISSPVEATLQTTGHHPTSYSASLPHNHNWCTTAIMPSTIKTDASKVTHNGSSKSNSSSSSSSHHPKHSEAIDRYLAEDRDHRSLAVNEYDSHQAHDRWRRAEYLVGVLSKEYWSEKDAKKRSRSKNDYQMAWRTPCFWWHFIAVWLATAIRDSLLFGKLDTGLQPLLQYS